MAGKLKGLVLSGGAGTRLRPITHTSAKQLVPVANKPVLFYGLEAMAAAGIREVGIIIGDTGDEIREAVGDGSQFGIEATFIPQDAPRGLAHAVLTAEEFIGDSAFCMYLGDNLLRDGVAGFVDEFRGGDGELQKNGEQEREEEQCVRDDVVDDRDSVDWRRQLHQAEQSWSWSGFVIHNALQARLTV